MKTWSFLINDSVLPDCGYSLAASVNLDTILDVHFNPSNETLRYVYDTERITEIFAGFVRL